jgi:arsenite oxidase large subunit
LREYTDGKLIGTEMLYEDGKFGAEDGRATFLATPWTGYPEPDIKPGQVFLMFAYPNGIAGDLTTDWTDQNVVPYYKGAWANLRRVGTLEEYKNTVSFKSRRY